MVGIVCVVVKLEVQENPSIQNSVQMLKLMIRHIHNKRCEKFVTDVMSLPGEGRAGSQVDATIAPKMAAFKTFYVSCNFFFQFD